MRARILLRASAFAFLLSATGWAASPKPVECAKALYRVFGERPERPDYKEESERVGCGESLIYCVGPDGQPLPGETAPALRPSDVLTIKLLGPSDCADTLSVASNVRVRSQRLFRKLPTGPAAKSGEQPAPVLYQLLATTSVEVDKTTEEITVVVARTDTKKSIRGAELKVVQFTYLLDVGLLTAFAFDYSQVKTARIPGTDDSFIRETSGIHAGGAIALSVFPCGQYDTPRFSRLHGFGVQVGIGADLSRVDDEFYFGAIYEAIPGVGLSAGVALLEMQTLQPSYPEGTLAAVDDLPADTALQPAFYLGVSLNTQVLDTIVDLGKGIHVP